MTLKVGYSREVGQAKNVLFQEAFKRIERSIALGFHLEAIAIIESLICDRLETIVAICSDSAIKPSTLGPLINRLSSYKVIEGGLLNRIDDWRMQRNLVLHQMVKITNLESANWRARMRFARTTALEGKEILRLTQREVRRIKQKKLKDGSSQHF
jgi:hypothetical protein